MKEKVLIVGCGDLGQHVAFTLTKSGIHSIGLRRQACASNQVMEMVYADVTQPASLQLLEKMHPTIVIYCVAATAQTDQNYYSHYVDGLKNVLNALTNTDVLRHVFFVSSTRMYGQSSNALMDEMMTPVPQDFGGSRLLEAEKLLDQPHQKWRGTALRLTGIYGPGREYMINLARDPSKWPLKNSWTNRIHRDDAAAFIVHLIKRLINNLPVDDCYVVTDSHPVSQYEVLRWMADKMGVSVDGRLPEVVGGKRMSNQRMLSTGFSLEYPDYQTGYLSLLPKA